MTVELLAGDCRAKLSKFLENTFDACVTDPPYAMGMDVWDKNVPTADIWRAVLRTMKPGAFLLASSPALYHRMATNVEDAGFKIQDQVMWMTTTKMAKYNRLKPAHEPFVVAQKPYEGTLNSNFNKWGRGKINIDDARVPWDKAPPVNVADGAKRRKFGKGAAKGGAAQYGTIEADPNGRYPMNIIGDVEPEHQNYFYAPRVSRSERGDYNDHVSPKPISLMEYLIKIYTPHSGVILDPFCGSGSTGIAALNEGRSFVGIDLSQHYLDITQRRIAERHADVVYTQIAS